MLQRLRERLTLILIALLPLHALLVTVGTKLIAGPGHAPLTALALWKEGVLVFILALAMVEVALSLRRASSFRLDVMDLLILALIILGIVVTAFTHQDWKLAVLGFKYDFLPLVAFFVLRRATWSEGFLDTACKVLLAAGAVTAAYGLTTLLLPREFFLWLGYGDAHSLYFPDQPLASFQLIAETGIRRIQSTFSGPNQFGLWLLIPLAIILTQLKNLKGRHTSSLRLFGLFVFLGGALFFSFSRSAWIGAAVMTLVALHGALPRRIFWRSFAALMLVGVVVAAAGIALSPKALGRLSSSRGHLTRPLEAVHVIIAHPFGLGLGTAGPASNRVSETCVMLRPQDDPAWAKSQPTLCVFLGTTQVQPADHICRCPFHPENWYLQIGVEFGVLGFILFIALVIVILRRLGKEHTDISFIFLAFLAISIAAFFLHAWEDAAIASTLWILTAVSVPARDRE
ncbi:MAG: O-antigen ligase family protein [Candidatus Peribacteraceae bacterium]|nr:O-antigen ligase family protein [Candidatus Peribacteraceae bacterium]